ncbi:MAG: TonB-dependent receptor [Blastocatellia bacterium]|nr:TonB-dependent receptor [Blastocatellia bacterium]
MTSFHEALPRALRGCVQVVVLLGLLAGAAQAQARIVVVDEAGGALPGVSVSLASAQGAALVEGVTGADGVFALPALSRGAYQLTLAAAGFRTRQTRLVVDPSRTEPVEIVMSAGPIAGAVTVTAVRGSVAEAAETAEVVAARDEASWQSRPIALLGNALEGSPGVLVQQSTYGQVSPFLRGLTGYQVLNLIDGIRFNNSTFRSGPNQYLAFIEPSQARRVEALLGPTGVQYGSDALGGTINVLTELSSFSKARRADFHGELQTFGASADASGGGHLKLSLGTSRLALLAGGSWRRQNDLRAGNGEDSRHVFTRFFGLSGEQVRRLTGERMQDTGFAQYGGHVKLALRLRDDQSLTLWYQRGVMEGVRGYKDLWGGLGRLRSDFAPQELDFAYARYEKQRFGVFDSVSGTFSLNAQRDGSVRQNLRAIDRITTDDNNVNAFGYAGQATTHLGQTQAIVFGGELYREQIRASRVETDPAAGTSVQRRALYPNGSRYTTTGLFAQHTAEWFGRRLRTGAGGRFTRIGFQTFAARNRTAAGASLGVTDEEEHFQDATFNASLNWRMTEAVRLHAIAGRGFRAPNLNDLGALGLNDLGFEVPASEAAAAGAFLGTSDGETAASSGRRVTALQAESLLNYEMGISFEKRRLYARAQVFDAELERPIVRRTLLFPADRLPTSVAGLPVQPIAPTAEQRAQGVAPVAVSLDPRALKAFVNDGAARYYGLETIVRYGVTSQLTIDGNYSYIVGRELNPNRFIRRLPPQLGTLSLRYQPSGMKWLRGRLQWIELGGDFAGAQTRLSGGDLTDERIGAARRRRDILDFFRGSLVRPFLDPGADGAFGTNDDRFRPTGETLLQIQDRVLPLGAVVNGVRIADDASRAPLYLSTAGYGVAHLRGGFRVTEQLNLEFAVMNLLDKNYRVHGSGVDSPGRNLFVRLRYSF